MLRIILVTVIFGLIITAAVLAGDDMGWFSRPSFFPIILIFFMVSNLALHGAALRTMNRAPEDFVRVYLIATVLRILLFGTFIYVVILLDRPGAGRNTAFFLLCYFLFTMLEVFALFRQINAQKQSQEGQKRL